MFFYIKNQSNPQSKQLADERKAAHVQLYGKDYVYHPEQCFTGDAASYFDEVKEVNSDFLLSSREFKEDSTFFPLTDKVALEKGKTLLIGGPCSVESYDQVMRAAESMASIGIQVFRAGAFKPRTTPWKFQGLGDEGLRLLEQVREKFGMAIITEVRSGSHVKAVADAADIVQVGAKAMYDHDILHGCGAIRKPVLLKRGFASTVKELLLAADFILSGGNDRVALCFRGTRDFESSTRFTMDIGGAGRAREFSHLPIVLDPSHGVGRSSLVPEIGLACAAMSPAGLLIEAHPNPAEAKSDADQALSLEEFKSLQARLSRVCQAVDMELC